MTLVLDLPVELQDQLAQDAARLGLPLTEYVLRVLSTNRLSGTSPRTGMELLAYWEHAGVVGARPETNDPQEHARTLRRQAEVRQRS